MSFKRIVVATDFSETSHRALELGLEIAQKFDAELILVHSWEAPSYSYGGGVFLPVDLVTPIEQAAVAQLERALTALQLRMPRATSMLRTGPAWEEVLAAAAQLQADLLVLGTHGRRGMSRALLGSVAEKVVRIAPIPVLTVHGGPTPA
jgi:nucleotide-binding universal stress UspA family protein